MEDVESDNTVEDKETGNEDSDCEEGIKRTTLDVKHDTETEEENKLSIGLKRLIYLEEIFSMKELNGYETVFLML